MASIQKNRIIALWLIACTIALYALSARDGHNWKGDFSQYIMHAQNLIQGKSYTDLGVLSIDGVAHAGTPPGYPLTIAPLIALFGLNFIVLKVQMAFIFGLGLWIYWRHVQSEMPSQWTIGTLAFLAFTPWILKFSNNLLTDIPYFTASLLAIYVGHRFFQNQPNLKSALYLSLSLILACSFRSVGIVIIGTAVIYAVLFRRKHLMHTLGFALLSYLSMAFINRHFEAGGSYANQFSLDPYIIANAIWQNAIGLERSLMRMIALYPSRNEDSWLYSFVNLPILMAYLSLMCVGIFRSIKKRGFYLQDLYWPLSLVPLLIYPYPMRSRYLLPLLPFTHFYVMIGFRYLLANISNHFSYLPIRPIYRYRIVLPALLWMPLFMAYWGHYTFQPTTAEANILKDPDVQNLFIEVNNRKQEISRVLFWRPRMLRLFTKVNTAGVYNLNEYPWTPKEIFHIKNLGVSHVILDPNNPKLTEFTTHNPHLFKSLYQNPTFHLMRIESPPKALDVVTP
jgi:hypothetical protein